MRFIKKKEILKAQRNFSMPINDSEYYKSKKDQWVFTLYRELIDLLIDCNR